MLEEETAAARTCISELRWFFCTSGSSTPLTSTRSETLKKERRRKRCSLVAVMRSSACTGQQPRHQSVAVRLRERCVRDRYGLMECWCRLVKGR